MLNMAGTLLLKEKQRLELSVDEVQSKQQDSEQMNLSLRADIQKESLRKASFDGDRGKEVGRRQETHPTN